MTSMAPGELGAQSLHDQSPFAQRRLLRIARPKSPETKCRPRHKDQNKKDAKEFGRWI